MWIWLAFALRLTPVEAKSEATNQSSKCKVLDAGELGASPIPTARDLKIDWQVCKLPDDPHNWIAYRRFRHDKRARAHLVADADSLQVGVMPKACEKYCKKAAGPPSNSHWQRLRDLSTQPTQAEQNAGLAEAETPLGSYLTWDLCPTPLPLTREPWEQLHAHSKKINNPLPVALAVSGSWLRQHAEDLAWLREQERAGKFAFTWVNHSNHHFFKPELPVTENFMLLPKTNARAEIVLLEQQLLRLGLMPSLFFRFPGLISSESLLKTMREHGLIVIGSNAWLAKGGVAKPGSFILVHANGNEAKGLKLFSRYFGLGQVPLPFLPLVNAWTKPANP